MLCLDLSQRWHPPNCYNPEVISPPKAPHDKTVRYTFGPGGQHTLMWPPVTHTLVCPPLFRCIRAHNLLLPRGIGDATDLIRFHYMIKVMGCHSLDYISFRKSPS